MDAEKLLYDITELSRLFRDSVSIETLLDRAVEMVAARTHAAVCSIYLYRPAEQLLTLRATCGLHPDSIGQVHLGLGQGLTGLALQEMKTVCEKDASRNPNYRFFPGIFEERFDAFLAVPISRGLAKLGVLVLQRDSQEAFTASDITALETVASQLANIIGNAQFLLDIHEARRPASAAAPTLPQSFVGKVAAPGLAYGAATIRQRRKSLSALMQRKYVTTYNQQDFRAAVLRTAQQLERLQERVEDKLSDAASLIFAAHLMILKDRVFLDQIEARIAAGLNAPVAIAKIASQYSQSFLAVDNTYMQEKVNDIEDLTFRLIDNLLQEEEGPEPIRQRVVVTRSLFPSDLLKLSSEEAGAIVLVGGGVTSHLSILARSLGLPMVICNCYELLDLANGTPILVDAETGHLYIRPDQHTLDRFHIQPAAPRGRPAEQMPLSDQTLTRDGVAIQLLANVNLLTDLSRANALNCAGVGLYRTEFPFIVRSTFPSEAEQFVLYRKLTETMRGKPVIFRTLDAGGDKILSYYHDVQEQNPAMGMRSIRFALKNRSVFTGQIRAILRAGADADLRIVFPMISSLDEFCQAREAVWEAIDALREQAAPHHDHPQLGMMVELPCVIPLMDAFAEEVDFFSIGTNDFIQFMLGVDRTNDSVADAYLPHHPSVLMALSTIVDVARRHGREVSLCGDMAHEPLYIPFLLGIGIRTLSVDPAYLLGTQRILMDVSTHEAEATAAGLLAQRRISDIEGLLARQNRAGPGA